ncbi:TPA: hypothetical protein ACRZZI_004985 [Vibrio harveyi]
MNNNPVRYEPEYETVCENCGNAPTVRVVDEGEKMNLGLCGPCCWGEAEAVDPSTWN